MSVAKLFGLAIDFGVTIDFFDFDGSICLLGKEENGGRPSATVRKPTKVDNPAFSYAGHRDEYCWLRRDGKVPADCEL